MTAERTQRRGGDDRRREIADAALRIIASRGVRGFTAMAIAQEIGLTDGALFRHFRSKDAIVDAALDRIEELLFEGFPPQDEDPVERLGAFFRRRVAVIREHPAISRLVATEELAKAGSAESVERVAAFRVRSSAFVRACLAEAERRALLSPGLHAEEAAVVVLGALLALAHSSSAPPPEATSTVAPRVWAALESLLRGPPARSPQAGRRPPRSTRRPSR